MQQNTFKKWKADMNDKDDKTGKKDEKFGLYDETSYVRLHLIG